MNKKPIVMSTLASAYFAESIATALDAKFLPTERMTFGGVEHYYRIDVDGFSNLFGQDVILVGSTHSDLEVNEIYRLGCALSGYGVRRIIFCIPFFGYSTMERAVKPGEVVTAKAIARQFSAIPQASMGNTFLLMDLHVGGTIHYFESDCTRFELYAEAAIEAGIRTIIKAFPNLEPKMASADLGRAKWVETFADVFGTDIAFIRKGRDGAKTVIKGIIGQVKDQHVIIYDDMTRSAGTLIQATEAYLAAGARMVSVVLSHLALNDKTIAQRLIDSPITAIVATNSHPASQWSIIQKNRKFEIVDVSHIFVEVIEKILA